ncbi:MAG: hypothetical protein AAGD14_09445 [Planctomycetota bacterium]
MALVCALAAAAVPLVVVRLSDRYWKTGRHTWMLRDVSWNRLTHRVSAVLEFDRPYGVRRFEEPTIEIGTYDHTVVPFRIHRRPVAVSAVIDPNGRILTWRIEDFALPDGEKFAGIYVTGGSYVCATTGKQRKLRVTLASAHNQW